MMAESNSGEGVPEQTTAPETRDVGLMPAVMAIFMIVAVAGLVACAVGAWAVFRQSPQLAAGTLKAHYIPVVEQSNLNPAEKAEVVRALEQLALEMKAGQWEPWQANAMMQNLIRAPIVQWGDLDAIEQLVVKIEAFSPAERENISKVLGRLKHGIEEDLIIANVVEEILAPVTIRDDSERGCHLNLAMDKPDIEEVVQRAQTILAGHQIPDERYNARLADVLRLQIEKAQHP
jgi:hypothetical protein